MNGEREETASSKSSSCCKIHTKEIEVGVCPLCLNERLLILAASQRSTSRSHNKTQLSSESDHCIKKPTPFFAFLGFFQFPHHNHHSVISPEESFISIKFEENGAASWEKGGVSKISLQHCDENVKETMIQHPKSRPKLRWRKRIRQLLHVISLRSPSSACHVSSKVASSRWIIRPSANNNFPN